MGKPRHCLFAASGLDALRQKGSQAGHTAVPRGARGGWLLFSRGRNSQDLSAWPRPAELLHRLVSPRPPALTLRRHSARGLPRPGPPLTWWRSQERTHMLPLAVPSSSSPPGKSTAVCQAPSEHIAPGLAGVDPKSGTPRLRCTPEGRGEKGSCPRAWRLPVCLLGGFASPPDAAAPYLLSRGSGARAGDGAGDKPTSATGDGDAAPANDPAEKCSSCSGAGGTDILCT